MVDCRPKLVTVAVFWLALFAVSLGLYISRFFSAQKATCTIQEEGKRISEKGNSCRYSFLVEVTPEQSSDMFKANGTMQFSCGEKEKASFRETYGVNKVVPCWYGEACPSDVHIPYGTRENLEDDVDQQLSEFSNLSKLLLGVAIIFALFSIFVVIRIFKLELIRRCPLFVLTAWMNLPLMRVRRRTPSQASVPPGLASDEFILPPPAVASRRRISKLVEGAKLSTSEAEALHEEGWICCICLEEKGENEQLRPVTRLKCNHSTHSECLRLWLERGRAACCLCNADVFSDATKEPSGSSRASSVSGEDTGLIGSLVVERTDRTPSSPGTSVFIDASQPYSDTPPSNDERDCDS